MIRTWVLLTFLVACKSTSGDPSCADVARRATELIEARERADREQHPSPGVPELDGALHDATLAAVNAACEKNKIPADRRRCITREAKTVFDLTGACAAYQLNGMVGPELTCPPGAHQRSPQVHDRGWETWCEAGGKRNGESTTFDDHGDFIVAAHYKDDVLDGPYAERDGLFGQYKAGKKHGTWLRKYTDGYKQAELELVDDVATGRYVSYYDSEYENVDEEGTYAENRPTGEWRGRWENSQHLQFKGSYDAEGERTGTWTFFHDVPGGNGDGDGAGKVAATGTYRAGERVDGWVFKAANGEPMTEDEAREVEWLARRLFEATPSAPFE